MNKLMNVLQAYLTILCSTNSGD